MLPSPQYPSVSVEQADYAAPAEHIVAIVAGFLDETGRVIDPVAGYPVDKQAMLVDVRLATCIVMLVAKGKCRSLLDAAIRIMDRCLVELGDCRWEVLCFYLRELAHGLLYLKGQIASEQWDKWLELFAGLMGRTREAMIGQAYEPFNVHTFALVAEVLMGKLGIAVERRFLDEHLAAQLALFDEDGLYHDAFNPMTYEVTPRANISLVMHHGYTGSQAKVISGLLRKGAECGLMMQSTNGEAAYGGRSNQFHFVEASHALCFEHQARMAESSSDADMAGIYRGAAAGSVQSILRWVYSKPMRHQKNMFEPGRHGVDCGGTYVMYGITAALMLLYADMVAKADIPAAVPESWPHVFLTNDDFHKVFMRSDPYFVQIDTNGDRNYEISGLGRFHCAGAPSELGPSTAAAATPRYTVAKHGNYVGAAVVPGVLRAGQCYSPIDQPDAGHTVAVKQSSLDGQTCTVCLDWSIVTSHASETISQLISLSPDGIKISLNSGTNNPRQIYWPILLTNGQQCSAIKRDIYSVEMTMASWKLVIRADDNTRCLLDDRQAINRNGVYSLVKFVGACSSIHAEIIRA